MNKLKFLAIAAVLTVLGAGPAAADWQTLGSAEFDTYGQRGEFHGSDGPVRNIQIFADANPLECRNVHVEFADGQGYDVFSGRLAQGQSVVFDVPGRARNIRRITWECRSLQRRAILRVLVQGERIWPGRSRDYDDYRDHPVGDWERDRETSGWLGTIELNTDGGYRDMAGPARPVRGIVFYADANPIYCRSIRAEFDNGEVADIFSGQLAQGQSVYADLPGDLRRVRRLLFECRSEQRVALLRVRGVVGR